MSLHLRRAIGQELLIVPKRPHSADEITEIRVTDLGPRGDIGFAFNLGEEYGACLKELYWQRHGDQLIEERCEDCGVPIALKASEYEELAIENKCVSCHRKAEREDTC